MKILIQNQKNPVASKVISRIAIIRPILTALLAGIRTEVADEIGGRNKLKLLMLPKAYRDGCGDVGFCFEWAIHDAIRRQDPMVMDRLADALRYCKLPGPSFQSILFGIEKSGKTRIIDTVNELFNNKSRILTGVQDQQPKLKSYINMLSAAFHRPYTRAALTSSINDLWKADLFLGSVEADLWIGTTLKINVKQLEGARGIRVGIVPANQGASDKIYKDDSKNLVVCPIPYDGSFMKLFYTGWRIVQQFIAADARIPTHVFLPVPADRQVASELEMLRTYPIVDVIEALEAQSQKDLLEATVKHVEVVTERDGSQLLNDLVISPVASYIKSGLHNRSTNLPQIIAAANFSSASWVCRRRSNRMRSLPKPANHPLVRSTTQL